MDGYGWLKMGEMDGMVEIVPQFALSFGATYTTNSRAQNSIILNPYKLMRIQLDYCYIILTKRLLLELIT